MISKEKGREVGEDKSKPNLDKIFVTFGQFSKLHFKILCSVKFVV
jgi:hypothetical protein